MPYRPEPDFRRNISGVILPLTAAIARIYGVRADDGAYPLGAFYTENVDRRIWCHVGGIWYAPLDPERIRRRRIRESRIQQFAAGILHGAAFALSNGTIVTWERLPQLVSASLPAVYRA